MDWKLARRERWTRSGIGRGGCGRLRRLLDDANGFRGDELERKPDAHAARSAVDRRWIEVEGKRRFEGRALERRTKVTGCDDLRLGDFSRLGDREL